jgi:hypothetical protein
MGTVELECGDGVAVWGSVQDGLDKFGCWAHGLCLGDNT